MYKSFIFSIVLLSPQPDFRTFSSLPKETPYSGAITSLFPPPPHLSEPLAAPVFLLYRLARSELVIETQSYTVCLVCAVYLAYLLRHVLSSPLTTSHSTSPEPSVPAIPSLSQLVTSQSRGVSSVPWPFCFSQLFLFTYCIICLTLNLALL